MRILKLQAIPTFFTTRRYLNGRCTGPELLAIGFLVVFCLLRLPYFLGAAYVFDEEKHTLAMQTLRIENFEAFGAAYWVAGYLIIKLFGGYALSVMRLLAFASLLYTAFSLYRISRISNKPLAPFVFLLAMTSPVFWFGGKLITPEFYQLALISFVAIRSFHKKTIPWWGYLALGFVVGIKLSAITLVLFLILLDEGFPVSVSRQNIKKLIAVSGFFIAGYILSSPNIVYAPLEYKRLFFTNIGHVNGLRPDFWTMKILTWDYIQDWGLLYYISPVALIAFAIFMSATRNWKILAIGSACLGLLVALILKNESFLPWHAFLSVAILWFAFAFAKPIKAAPLWLLQVCLGSCIILNTSIFIQQWPLDWKGQQEFLQQQKHRGDVDNCLRQFAQNNVPQWGRARPVMCYSNYRVDGELKGFCDSERLSNVMNSEAGHPQIFKLYKMTRSKFKELLSISPVIFIANKNIENIYGEDYAEQNTFLRSMTIELKEQESFPVSSKIIGVCGPYQIFQYEAENVALENKK